MNLKPEQYKQLEQSLTITTLDEQGAPSWWTGDEDAAAASMAAAMQFSHL